MKLIKKNIFPAFMRSGKPFTWGEIEQSDNDDFTSLRD